MSHFKVDNKNKTYLDYIRGLSCLICEKPAGLENDRIDPHHQEKKNDYMAVPLCRGCHNYLGNVGKLTNFWNGQNPRNRYINIERKIIELLSGYIKER